MNHVLVLTKNFRDVMWLADAYDIPRTQLIHANDIQRVQGLSRGLKYIVIGNYGTTPRERQMLEHMKIRLHTEIDPDGVREAVFRKKMVEEI